MTVTEALLALAVMTAGALVQGAVGFGASLLAVPLLLLIDPQLVPTPIIVASLVLNLLMIHRERGRHHWQLMRWPIIGLVPGSAAGALIVAAVATDDLSIFFGILVLVAVALSVTGRHPQRTPANLGVAGVLSGFMGTAVGIGGPPIALLFQRSTGAEIRGALSRFFLASAVISLVLLTAVGQVSGDDLAPSLVLIAGMVLGYAGSALLAHRVNEGHVRTGVLVLSASSAIVGIARALT